MLSESRLTVVRSAIATLFLAPAIAVLIMGHLPGLLSAGEGAAQLNPPEAALPVSVWSWQTVPGVIRDDGVDAFFVEVDVGSLVARAVIEGISPSIMHGFLEPIDLHDDGLVGDRQAGDFVYTAGPFSYDPSVPLPGNYLSDPDSPAGLHVMSVGRVVMELLDGSITVSAVDPAVGILRSDVPAVPMRALSEDIVVSPHLVNLRTSGRVTQSYLRGLDSDMRDLTNAVYDVLPDAFDFMMFFSTNRVEHLVRTTPRNFQRGAHASAQVDFSGTGQYQFDTSATYGSGGALLGVNVLDVFGSGILTSNATHELLHQWVAFQAPKLGLTDGSGHYLGRTSAGSLVGGFKWEEEADGTYTLDCMEGSSGAREAAPLDKYMMGLIEASAVPPLRAYDEAKPSPLLMCGETIDEITATVTIEDIQAQHGARVPGPGDAQRSFVIAFVAESHGRLLTPTEMTFYDTFAEHYTKPVPPEDPAPYVGSNWASIDRFFGEGTSWSSDIATIPTGTPAPTAAETPPTHTAEPTSTALPTATATPTLGAAETAVPSATPTTTPTASGAPTALPTATPSLTPTTAATPTAIPTATPTLTPTTAAAPTATPTLAGPTNGDVNCDGRVDAEDSLALLQLGAGLLEALGCPESGDLNGDGLTNASDAAIVLQFLAGFLSTLPSGLT